MNRGSALMLLGSLAFAQQPPRESTLELQAQTPRTTQASTQSARAASPFDITGYWVSVINEDWRWRMITPDKGDFSSVPLNWEGRRVADTWDATKDDASGDRCRAYGAPALMRLPTRLHVTWADDNTLKIETDYGTQIRLLHFANPPAQNARTRQGISTAQWQFDASAKPSSTAPAGPRNLKVETTALLAGYLRRNGIPYSENARLIEYFDLFPALPNGDQWLVITAIVDDPRYLTERFLTSSNFKREADGAKWHPTACSAR